MRQRLRRCRLGAPLLVATGCAVELAIDLRDLAARDGEQAAFAERFAMLRKGQIRRRGFFDRWKIEDRRG